MDNALATTLAIAILVFGPMMLILWFSFRKYSYPYTTYTYFDDRKVAMLLAVGIGVGMVFSICYLFFDITVVSYALIFAVLEEIVRVVVLNHPKFQLKFDTTFYGFALGLGNGSVIMIAVCYITSATNTDFFSPALLGILAIYSFTLALFYASMGALVGFGSYKGKIWTFCTGAIGLHILFNIVILPFRARLADLYYPSIFGSLVIGLAVYFYVYRTILPSSLPDKLRRQRMREIRKGRRLAKRF